MQNSLEIDTNFIYDCQAINYGDEKKFVALNKSKFLKLNIESSSLTILASIAKIINVLITFH